MAFNSNTVTGTAKHLQHHLLSGRPPGMWVGDLPTCMHQAWEPCKALWEWEGAESMVKYNTCFNVTPYTRFVLQIILGNPPSDELRLKTLWKCCCHIAIENKIAWKTITFQCRKIISNQRNLKFSWDTTLDVNHNERFLTFFRYQSLINVINGFASKA